ncbi:MAG: ABC transporter ATP-binding protein/permease [Butyrivibrio sp.]|nr:ABC transporter ATP-binding protein/permease [Acetatifactor muris]MCM1558430.1 ABC transporter ATP-binding protein/permease [Butyrivibrio sp.]
MQQESKLLEKQSFRQQLDNVRRVMKLLVSLDRGYVPLNLVSVLLAACLTYGGMLLSAYVLNQIAGGFAFSQLLGRVIFCVVFLSLGRSAENMLNRRIDVRSQMLSEKYQALQQEKIMQMDFALLDSPRLKEMRERIQLDNNWGAGIFSMFWQGKGVLGTLVELVAAVIIGAPVFAWFGKEDMGWAAAILFLLCLCLGICMKLFWYFRNKSLYALFHVPDREEKKFLWNYVWDFAYGSWRYRYGNGKDVRIYDSYEVMKRWTYDKLWGKKWNDYVIKRPGIGQGGSAGVWSAMYVLSVIGAYCMVALAALKGNMPVGSLILYAGCLSNILNQAANIVMGCCEVSLTARKQIGVMELLELSDEMYKGSLPMEKRSDNEYRIEFKNVSFKYPGSETYALKDFSMELRVGERLAIVGRNGSGKTTMIKLLCRLYDPQEGEILVNGVDIKKFRHDEYSRLFSVVFQDYVLFALMLAENIAADKDYDGDKVRQCLTDAGFGERLAKMGEKGIESYLYKDYTDEGIEISGGEAQKLAIARAIYKEAPFVLLDEPTAALDPIAEAEIYHNFDRIAGNKTAIYISHRLSSCRFCDKIAVFDRGRLVQTGSHEELLAQEEGVYASLWNAQAKYYEM